MDPVEAGSEKTVSVKLIRELIASLTGSPISDREILPAALRRTRMQIPPRCGQAVVPNGGLYQRERGAMIESVRRMGMAQPMRRDLCSSQASPGGCGLYDSMDLRSIQ